MNPLKILRPCNRIPRHVFDFLLQLSGMRRVLADDHATLRNQETEKSCADQLRSLGYAMRIIPKVWWDVFLPANRPIYHNHWLSAALLSL